MTAGELQTGIAISVALLGAGVGVRSYLRFVLEPTARTWFDSQHSRVGSPTGYSRGLVTPGVGALPAHRAATPHSTTPVQVQPAALR